MGSGNRTFGVDYGIDMSCGELWLRPLSQDVFSPRVPISIYRTGRLTTLQFKEKDYFQKPEKFTITFSYLREGILLYKCFFPFFKPKSRTQK